MYCVYFFCYGFLERNGSLVLFSSWLDAMQAGNKENRAFEVLEVENIRGVK